jgi:hypothetical protein
MSKLEFDAIIQSPDDAPKAAFITAPFDIKELFGTKGRIAVKGTIDGVPFRGTFQPMGGCHIMGVPRELRAKIGKTHGDTIHVVMELDLEPRTVDVPDDFHQALRKNPDALRAFDKMSYSHRKEYVQSINDAKKPETRERRIQKAVERLYKGEKHS